MKKGFTLIELLAVIVLLAIIALIAIPIVLNIIQDLKKNSIKQSANSIIKSAEFYFMKQDTKYGKISVTNKNLQYDGKIPELGEVELNKDGQTKIYAYIDGYCVLKDFDSKKIILSKTSKEDCGNISSSSIVVENSDEINIVSEKENTLSNYKIYGNSIQNGDPTPSTPVEIQSVGEKTKNIYNPTIHTLTKNGIIATRNKDNTFTINGTATATAYIHLGTVSVDNDETYYLSGGTSDVRLAYQLRQGDTQFNTVSNKGGISVLDASEKHGYSCDTINVVIVVNDGITVNDVVVKPMISLINTDDYEPYGYKIPITIEDDLGNKNIENIYIKQPIRSIGNVYDYIDFETKKVYRKIMSEYIDSIVGTSSYGNVYTMFLSSIEHEPLLYGINIDSKGFAMANIFEKSDYLYKETTNYPNKIQTYITTDGANRVVYTLNDTSINTVELAEEKIGDGFEVQYVLATQIEEDIIVPEIELSKGSNKITVNTSIKPTKIEVFK